MAGFLLKNSCSIVRRRSFSLFCFPSRATSYNLFYILRSCLAAFSYILHLFFSVFSRARTCSPLCLFTLLYRTSASCCAYSSCICFLYVSRTSRHSFSSFFLLSCTSNYSHCNFRNSLRAVVHAPGFLSTALCSCALLFESRHYSP